MGNQPGIYFIWGGGISILGVLSLLFILLVRNKMAKDRNALQRIQKAIDGFNGCFVEIIHELKTTPKGVVFNLGGTIEEGHDIAKTQLEVCLNKRRVRRLNKIWSQYKNNTKKYYAKISGHDSDSSLSWRNEFISEINNMLKKVSKIT